MNSYWEFRQSLDEFRFKVRSRIFSGRKFSRLSGHSHCHICHVTCSVLCKDGIESLSSDVTLQIRNILSRDGKQIHSKCRSGWEFRFKIRNQDSYLGSKLEFRFRIGIQEWNLASKFKILFEQFRYSKLDSDPKFRGKV